MKLQRYSVEDGEWRRANEQGRFCLAEDVEALEAENAALHDECDRLTAMMSSNEGGIDKKDLFAGICVALQVITSMDYAALWSDLVQAVGQDRLLQYAAFTAPDEWELAGFKKYALRLLGCKKPASRTV